MSRLYAANTLGAAAGAAIGGWFLLGNLGFDGTVRLASSLNILAAAAVLLLGRAAHERAAPAASALASGPEAAAPDGRIWPWLALYAATGAAALALEVVYFRLVDGIMRSNSYTFAHVLTLYLVLFGAGAAAAGERARRSPRPDATFLWIQFWIGAASLLGVLLLLNMPSLFGIRDGARAVLQGRGVHLRAGNAHRPPVDDGARLRAPDRAGARHGRPGLPHGLRLSVHRGARAAPGQHARPPHGRADGLQHPGQRGRQPDRGVRAARPIRHRGNARAARRRC